jgi:serine/threonine protein kinase
MSSYAISLEEIGIQGSYTIPRIPSIEFSNVCQYNEKTKTIMTPSHQVRCSFVLESTLDHGSYGNIYVAKRGEHHVLVKQPRMKEMNLLQEAVLQHLAYKTLELQGLRWAIPKVYDVFWKQKEIWFSMERIYGVPLTQWFTFTKTPDTDTLFLIAQLCLILGTLESHLNLDHRDLKHTNLLLKQEPCTIHVNIHETSWTLYSPFTVVVLDFGFACLGSEGLRGTPYVTLGDGVLPPMDPCPKEGRDMFHFLISFLGLPMIQQKLSSRLHTTIDGWLSLGKKSYGPMARRWSTENWSYLVSSQPQFAIPNCCPLHILTEILPELKGSLTRT